MTRSMAQFELRPEQLTHRPTAEELPFETTESLAPLTRTVGQPRASEAVQFGIEMKRDGYNIYLAGASGTGRETTIIDELRNVAPTRPAPSDWAYVYNFREPDRPNALEFPSGTAVAFATKMTQFIDMVQRDVPAAFDSDTYEAAHREVVAAIGARRDELLNAMQATAKENQFVVESTQSGIASIPIVDGQPIKGEQYAQLTDEQRSEIDKRGEIVRQAISHALRQLRGVDREGQEAIDKLDRETTLNVIQPMLDSLRTEHADERGTLEYVDQVQADVLDHQRRIRSGPSVDPNLPNRPDVAYEEYFNRYTVNVLVDHHNAEGAPVIIERNPTWYNLLGRSEYRNVVGAMMADFKEIKPGALHRANGGFLVLHIVEVLRQPAAWEALTRALLLREIRVETLGEQNSALPTVTLRPEPIPLDVKVILVGTSAIYQLLYATDENFRDLFRIKAEFAPDMEWNPENVLSYAGYLRRMQDRLGTLPFERSAVARIVEHGARLCEDQRRLTTRMAQIETAAIESSHWARRAGREIVTEGDVDKALRLQVHRSDLAEERYRDRLRDGTIAVQTTGERIGQVNGMAVLNTGDHAFGSPSRITARVSLGRGNLYSIEREIDMSGKIHSKGFMILSGYLGGQYAHDTPLAMSATITFEQSYDEIDGDSASSTELYALLSALAEVPIKQSIAVTGAIDQYGNVQAVGGVTDKIEGFFDICKLRGLTGTQGVMIPAANIPNLMLKRDVIAAVQAEQFHIWAVKHVDEGIELLTGIEAGEIDQDCRFDDGTIHCRVQHRLEEFAEVLRRFGITGPNQP